jgi:hypothetical protein
VSENRNTIQRGDLIQLEWLQYRNDGGYLWDGENVINLYYDIDDYGSVPLSFSFPEFPFRYFENVIVHNDLVFLRDDLMAEASANVTFGKLPSSKREEREERDEREIAYSWFVYNNVKHTIEGFPDEALYEDTNYNSKELDLDIEENFNSYKMRSIELFEEGLRTKCIYFRWEGPPRNDTTLYVLC